MVLGGGVEGRSYDPVMRRRGMRSGGLSRGREGEGPHERYCTMTVPLVLHVVCICVYTRMCLCCRYCSATCQKAAWPDHKEACREAQSAAKK